MWLVAGTGFSTMTGALMFAGRSNVSRQLFVFACHDAPVGSDLARATYYFPSSFQKSGFILPIANMRAYIYQHLAEPLSTVELAKRFDLSPAHFGSLFRRFSGQTPIAYIQDRRIEAAKIILASSYAPISDLARSVGYDDALYFSRVFKRNFSSVFKRMEHISPKKYLASCNNPLIA